MMNGTNEEYRNKVDLLVMYNELYEENEKLKQDKQELIEWLENMIKEKTNELGDKGWMVSINIIALLDKLKELGE